MACTKLKQLVKGVTRHGTHEKFQLTRGTFLYTPPFGWWGSIGGVHLIFHGLIAIHRTKQHNLCLLAFPKLREISYRNYTLAAFMV